MSEGLATAARLARVAIAQHGAFTRAQAIAVGFEPGAIERRVRTGVWQRLLPRVYRHAATPTSPLLMESAAVLWAGPGCALSHTTAGTMWRMAAIWPDRPELIVARSRAPRAAGVVVHRVARIGTADVMRVGQLPVTSPLRTIVDLAGVLAERDLELVIDRARARGLVTVRSVEAHLDAIGTVGRPGVARLRAVLAAIGSGRVDPSARMAG